MGNRTPIPQRDSMAVWVYRVEFHSRDIPGIFKPKRIPGMPYESRLIWVKQRKAKDDLLHSDPTATVQEHQAKRCHRCGRWCFGVQAQMQVEREQISRLMGSELEPCSTVCRPDSGIDAITQVVDSVMAQSHTVGSPQP